jgi:hypothetical protein
MEFTLSEDSLDVLKRCSATLTSATLRKEGIKQKSSYSKRQKFACCEVCISPVGRPGKSATHLVMDMKPSGGVILHEVPTETATPIKSLTVLG